MPPAGRGAQEPTSRGALSSAGQDDPVPAGRAVVRQVADGFRYLVRHEILLVAYAVDFVTLFFGLPAALFPQLAHQRFGGPAAGGTVAGAPFAAISAGGVIAAMLAGLFSGSRRPGAMMAAAAFVWAGAIAGSHVTRSLSIRYFYNSHEFLERITLLFGA